jgi:hypothetical protein
VKTTVLKGEMSKDEILKIATLAADGHNDYLLSISVLRRGSKIGLIVLSTVIEANKKNILGYKRRTARFEEIPLKEIILVKIIKKRFSRMNLKIG